MATAPTLDTRLSLESRELPGRRFFSGITTYLSAIRDASAASHFSPLTLWGPGQPVAPFFSMQGGVRATAALVILLDTASRCAPTAHSQDGAWSSSPPSRCGPRLQLPIETIPHVST